MKIQYLAAGFLALVTPTLGAEWDCARSGGPGHSGLRQIHRDFNRLFGEARLTAVSGQKYCAVCSGLVFCWGNNHGVTVTEDANHRNIAAGTDPGSGSSCGLHVNPRGPGAFKHYIFARERDISFGGHNTIRRC
ncbi:hypothetical protein FQN57_000152 [Myotisia sp. PD_48]|nr:hypothetical protein FQN57_000152 [Myotisia sp. PD_48]